MVCRANKSSCVLKPHCCSPFTNALIAIFVSPCRTGVRIDNWVENEATYALAGTRRSVVDDGAPFFCSSNQQISYTSEGKQGADLLKSVFIARDDGYAVPSRKADTLLRHGDFAAPRIQCLATTYNLVHGPRRNSAVKVDSERHTQEFLWKVRADLCSVQP